MATIVTKTVKPGGGGHYTTLAAFMVGEQRNLRTLDQIARAEVYTGVDTARCTVSGFPSDATRYVLVEPAPGVHHLGRVDAANAYRLEVAGSVPALTLGGADDAHVRVRGIQIALGNASNSSVVRITARRFAVEECVVLSRTYAGTSGAAIGYFHASDHTDSDGYAQHRLAHNLLLNCQIPLYAEDTFDYSIELVAVNNSAAAGLGGSYRSAGYPGFVAYTAGRLALRLYNNAWLGYAGDWNIEADGPDEPAVHEAGNRSSAGPGPAAAWFLAPASNDYRPLSGGPLVDTGVDASAYAPATSINQVARPYGSKWDQGAFEYAPPSYTASLAATSGRASAALAAGHAMPVYTSTLTAQASPALLAGELDYRLGGGGFLARAQRATAALRASHTPPLFAGVVAAPAQPAQALLGALYTPSYPARFTARAAPARVRTQAAYQSPPVWLPCGARPYTGTLPRSETRGITRIGRPRD